ncbi:MAG: glutamate racemase [Lentisphaeria bacterium]|nr:glutamate racemase [Candidatus Neomarinimicrobiota bacterium]MCF7841583.1 glutamate racemase [Lentisphaeria bacterium]
MNQVAQNPIGIFDSGLGGISVVRAMMELLPDERLIYFGDTARVPYGSKSNETVRRFSRQIVNFLLDHQVKMVVVACNTASAIALDDLRGRWNLPIIGVIEPGATAAVNKSPSNRVGVIGTTSTIHSGAYEKALLTRNPNLNIQSKACPLLVPLVEEGWPEDDVLTGVLERYLSGYKQSPVESLILGCTHYPYLKEAIQRVIGPDVNLIDSGEETARMVQDILIEKSMAHTPVGQDAARKHHFYVSDFPQRFQETASRFLGRPLENLFRIELEVLESYSVG